MASRTAYSTWAPQKPTLFDGHYLRNRSTLDIGVLGYIGIVQHKEHSSKVLSIPPGTPCIYMYTHNFYPTRIIAVNSYQVSPNAPVPNTTKIYKYSDTSANEDNSFRNHIRQSKSSLAETSRCLERKQPSRVVVSPLCDVVSSFLCNTHTDGKDKLLEWPDRSCLLLYFSARIH